MVGRPKTLQSARHAILCVDDEPQLLDGLRESLNRRTRFVIPLAPLMGDRPTSRGRLPLYKSGLFCSLADGIMQPTGMSVSRCVAALTGLSGELDRVAAYGGNEPPSAVAPWSLQALIQDLTLDVDLRHDPVSKSLMSDIESEVYLPVIEKVLTLLRNAEAGESRAHPVAEAKALTHGALRTAVQRSAGGA